MHKVHEFQKQTLHVENSLTKDEKAEAIRRLNKRYDRETIQEKKESVKPVTKNVWLHYIVNIMFEII